MSRAAAARRLHGALWAAMLAVLAPAAGRACTVTATSLEFGTIDPLMARDTISTASITVTCPSLTSYAIALSAGAGSYAQRDLIDGAATLAYNLYADSADTQIWGDGTGGSVVVNASAGTPGTSTQVYGRVPYQLAAVPGTYSDSIVVTITY